MGDWFTDRDKGRFRDALQRFQNGCEDARDTIAEILNGAREKLKSYARSYSVSDAEDLAQEAIVAALEEGGLRWLWEHYGKEADPGVWLRLKLRNVANAKKKDQLPEESEAEGGELPDVCIRESSERDRERFWEVIRKCVGNELDFQILWLYRKEELDFPRVAELLCITHANARQREHYARERLKGCPQLIALAMDVIRHERTGG